MGRLVVWLIGILFLLTGQFVFVNDMGGDSELYAVSMADMVW